MERELLRRIVSGILFALLLASFLTGDFNTQFTAAYEDEQRSSSFATDQAGSSLPPSTEWNRTYGGPGDDIASSVVQLNDGGYAIVGFTDCYGAGSDDFGLIKTDARGNLLWNMAYGTSGREGAFNGIQADDGGFAMVGSTDSYGAGQSDFFFVKTDANGNAQWNRTYGGPWFDQASCIVQTIDGGYAIVGPTYSFSSNSFDFWLVKTDSSGNMQWNKTYGGATTEQAYSLIQTGDSGYAIAGYTTSFGLGGEDFYLVKTDAEGNMLWNRTYGGAYNDVAHSLIQTSDGGYALVGFTASLGAGHQDAWLVKTDSNGSIVWNSSYGGPGQDWATSLTQTAGGGYGVAGGTMSFGAGNFDCWFVETDSSGKAQYNVTYGGANDDWGMSLIQTIDGGYGIAGTTMSFGAGGKDFWLIKIGSNDSEPPRIMNVRHTPLYPNSSQQICFYANVTDNVAVYRVWLNFTENGGTTWLLKDMPLSEENTYMTSLGPYAERQIIGFFVVAYDTSGNMAYGSEIVPPLPEPPKMGFVLVSDQPANPLPNGRDVSCNASGGGTEIHVNVTEIGIYDPTVTYIINYSTNGGLTWISRMMTQISSDIWTFLIGARTAILFKIVKSDGSAESRMYWIIIGSWEYPIYLYFSTQEEYFPVEGLDFDYEQTEDNDIANNKASYDAYFSDYRPRDLDGDGIPDVPAYTFMQPKSVDDGCLVIEYWIYYAFNKYPIIDDMLRDDHEHDFETVYLWIDLATGNMKKMACSQHMWVNHYLFDVQDPPSRINLAVEEGGHGMVLLKDDDRDGLPDLNAFGYYELARALELDKPWFWAGWFGERINPASFVAHLDPWVIYDPRIPSTELHLFDDTSILTAGLDLNVIIPQLSLDLNDVVSNFQWMIDDLGRSYLLRTSFAANLLMNSGIRLQFFVSAPLYRQEFREPAKFWKKVSWARWLLKGPILTALKLAALKGLTYFAVADALGYLIPGVRGSLTTYVINALFDPVQPTVTDLQGNVLGYSSVPNNLPRGSVLATRNMTGGLYDLFCIFTNNSDEYEYELRAIENEGTYNFSLSRVDSNGSELVFNSIQIPIHTAERQKYIVNWTALELGLAGVQVFADADGDGVFERRFSSDSELTASEFRRGILPGDLNEDGIVDIFDAILLANAYNSSPGHPVWNQKADINVDDTIDIYDAIILATHYNQHYP